MAGKDEVLGAYEAGEADGGEADDVQESHDTRQVLDIGAHLNDAADVDAQHSDLLVEAGKLEIFDAGEVGGLELTGVEAVLEGVGVADGGAAPASTDVVLLVDGLSRL